MGRALYILVMAAAVAFIAWQLMQPPAPEPSRFRHFDGDQRQQRR